MTARSKPGPTQRINYYFYSDGDVEQRTALHDLVRRQHRIDDRVRVEVAAHQWLHESRSARGAALLSVLRSLDQLTRPEFHPTVAAAIELLDAVSALPRYRED